jgi:H+/Cl- antiporter ClcA
MRLLPNRRKKRSPIREADLMIAGGGAGVAAAFNTPLGGIMFAIEELCRHRTFHANGPILLAVIFAGLMSIAVLGQYVYFGRTPATVSWPDGVWPVLACGVAGGLLGGLFSRGLIASNQGLPGRVGVWAGQRPIALAAVCGLGTGLIGLMTSGLTYGTGYGESQAALGGHVSLPVYFMFAKLLVIWLAFLSRIPGGIFAPALAVGAGLGSNIALLIPGEHGSALMVLGMVGFLAGMTQAPITAFVIVMEMTANHQMFLPLMATAVVAHTLSCSVAPTPLYQALAGPALAKGRLRAEKLPPATHAPPPSALS